MSLDNLREKIDEIDKNIAYWLEKRFETVSEITEIKRRTETPVFNAGREREVVQKALKNTKNDAYKPYIAETFEAMMSISRKMQSTGLKVKNIPAKKITVQGKTAAYCGIKGSYGEEALNQYFINITGIPMATFGDVAKSVAQGEADYGVLPVENSSAGAVTTVEDLLLENNVYITGETVLPVVHHLLGVPGASEEDIKAVCSHPQAIEQCRHFIQEKGYAIMLSDNTAFAARDVAKGGDKCIAAIASARAAKLYNLEILRRNIQTSADNYTRFIVIENKLKHTGDKISIVCVLPHRPGSLYNLLELFAKRGLNLLKLLARPIYKSPWHYRFHIDLGGGIQDENVRIALEEAKSLCEDMKITGCYFSGGTL